LVIISCSKKFHSFALAEQMEKNGLLKSLYTTYAYPKNTLMRKFVKRVDKEDIPPNKIHTNIALAFPIKFNQAKAHIWNNLFDLWVAGKIPRSNSQLFIGWSGMSLHSIRAAKKQRMITIVERGSSHILFQNEILKEEYKKFNKNFSIHPLVIKKELKEYEEAAYISIPSGFVKNTFLQYGVNETKLIMNPYGARKPELFKAGQTSANKKKFTIVYLGTLSVRKGLIYLFEAISKLKLKTEDYEVWMIGKVEDEIHTIVNRFEKPNWKFFGHVNHYELPSYLSLCDIAVQPSIEEGLSMVIPQLMACGVPVIATTNTGGEEVIQDGVNGFIIPIRSPEEITEKIEHLYNNPIELKEMKKAAGDIINNGMTWDDYGIRYIDFINKISCSNCI